MQVQVQVGAGGRIAWLMRARRMAEEIIQCGEDLEGVEEEGLKDVPELSRTALRPAPPR